MLPSDLSGLQNWLDASVLTQADGATISAWPDRINSARDGVIYNGTGLASVRTNALNGLRVVRFTPTGGQLKADTAGGGAPLADYTAVCVARVVAANGGRVLTCWYGSTNWMLGFNVNQEDCFFDNGWVDLGHDYTAFPTAWKMHSGTSTGRTSNFWKNGVLTTTLGGLGGSGGIASPIMLNGMDYYGPNQPCDCEVAEVLVYNRKLSDAELLQIHAYLNTKWVLGLSIPQTFEASVAESAAISVYNDGIVVEPVGNVRTPRWNGSPWNNFQWNGIQGAVIAASVAESASIADITAVGTIGSRAESVGINDTVSATETLTAARAESVGIADTVSATTRFTAACNESTAAADALSSVADYLVLFAESAAIADARSAILTSDCSRAETAAVAETISNTAVRGASVTESNDIAENFYSGVVVIASFNDSVAISDASDAVVYTVGEAVLGEHVAVADAVDATAVFGAEQIEVIGTFDTISAAKFGLVAASVAETLAIVNTISAIPVMGAACAETAIIVDTRIASIDYASTVATWSPRWNDQYWNQFIYNGSAAKVVAASVAETVGITDTLSVGLLGTRVESATIVDAVAASYVTTASRAEAVAANDILDATFGKTTARNESVAVADFVDATTVFAAYRYEGTVAFDNISAANDANARIAETLYGVETIAVVSNDMVVGVAESVSIHDSNRVAGEMLTIPAVGFEPIRAEVITPPVLIAEVDDGFIYATVIPPHAVPSTDSNLIYATVTDNGFIYATVVSYGTKAEVDSGGLRIAA